MPEHPVVRRLLAFAIVLVIIMASLVMIFSPVEEEWPQGDLPTFVSESQMRRYLAERHESHGDLFPLLTDEAGSTNNYYSQTNVQVSGVDEMDSVKTNGEILFLTNYDSVALVKAYPSQDMTNMSELNFTELSGKGDSFGSVLGLFAYDDILAVIISDFGLVTISSPILGIPWNNGEPSTVCCLIDISDPYAPDIISRHSISGYYSGSRLIGENLYLLAQENIWMTGEVSIPQIGIDGEVTDIPIDSIRFDPLAKEVETYLNVLSLDLNTKENNFTSIITGYSGVIYVSQDNIYLTYVEYEYSSSDSQLGSVDETVTTVFRLHLDGLSVTPQAKGQVNGFPLNQFSLDEYEGTLRIATCSGWTNPDNRVYVLDQELKMVGFLTGIAPGESIQSARFMGDTLYLVTFLRTDPLFVIDLSDHTSPMVLGELVVPGFSTYLHPCSDHRLLGIGLENWTLKVSLFDVSDPTSPNEVDTYSAPLDSWSEALWDHKAVLFDDRYDLLMIPVTSWNEGSYYTQEQVLVIQVSEEGLSLKTNLTNGPYQGSARCAIIEDVLYTITPTTVVAWDMDTFDMLGQISYHQDPDVWPGAIDDRGDTEDKTNN